MVEIADELVPFHLFEKSNLVLVDYICPFKRSLLVLQLYLFVSELLPQQSFFVVEIEEHPQVFVELFFLLIFYDSFDLPLLENFVTLFLLIS